MNRKSDDSTDHKPDPRVQISTRVLPETRQKARIEAAHCNLSVSEWINHLIEQAISTSQQREDHRHVS